MSRFGFDVDDWRAGSSIDRLIDLRRVFGPRPRRRPPAPPRIGVGEITSSARRDTGALELISRLRQRARRGRVARPGGLAWYTPTGLVRYAVVAPDQSRILWQGNVGRIPGIAGMSTSQREAAVRALVAAQTGQSFRVLAPGHAGPDLVPTSRFDGFDGFDAQSTDEELADLVGGQPLPGDAGTRQDVRRTGRMSYLDRTTAIV